MVLLRSTRGENLMFETTFSAKPLERSHVFFYVPFAPFCD
jgi:hypothetical protein